VRYWTVSEARAYLPRVRELAECIQHAAKLRAGQAGSANGKRAPILDAQEALEELQQGDILFRDAMTGLLDFHAKGADGVVYFWTTRIWPGGTARRTASPAASPSPGTPSDRS
jgi:hypothetical protein